VVTNRKEARDLGVRAANKLHGKYTYKAGGKALKRALAASMRRFTSSKRPSDQSEPEL